MSEHGNRATYVAGCRCADCRYANTAYHRIQQAEQRRLAAIGRAVEALVKRASA